MVLVLLACFCLQMGLSTFLLPILLCNLGSSVLGDDVCLSAGGEKVTVTVKGATTIANTDDPFVCATLDWWPPTKCDYKMCPWGSSSILNLDLDNPILLKAVQAFNPLRLRLGGSLQNRLLYNVRNSTQECKPFERSPTGLFGFTEGCLEMERWDKVNEFIGKARAVVTFGLNALYGRKKPCKDPNDTLWTGAWGSTNAYQFIQYTISKGYKVDSWEFGNELSGIGIKARVEPYQYGKDMILLKQLLKELYKNTSMQAKLLGPGGFFNQTWYTRFLQSSGENVVDAITHHIYNLGPGNGSNLSDKMQDPFYLYNVAQIYSDIQVAAQSFPWASVWMTESGGAYNSGGKESHNFANSFWYLDQLGMTSTFNHKVFCRQSLIGGNYGLLNTTTMVPNPDYYSALLFHRLMGPGVLAITHNGNPYLRAYSHCSREKPGITLLLINLSNSTSVDVSVVNDMNLHAPQDAKEESSVDSQRRQREEYHLTVKDGYINTTTMLLNGCPLEVTSTGDIPPLDPVLADSSSPLKVAPLSITFAIVRDFKAPACN